MQPRNVAEHRQQSTVFIGKIQYSVDDGQLFDLLTQRLQLPVVYCFIIRRAKNDPEEPYKSKGCAMAEFETPADAQRAIKLLDGFSLSSGKYKLRARLADYAPEKYSSEYLLEHVRQLESYYAA